MAVNQHVFLAQGQCCRVIASPLLIRHRIRRDHVHLHLDGSILGIRKRLQLHLRHLPRISKADVLIGNGDHTANRMNGQLLDDTGDRGNELCQLLPLVGFAVRVWAFSYLKSPLALMEYA